MQRKDHIDAFGVVSLIGFSALLGFNQVVIKVVNGGFQPVFSAGLRSLGGMVLLFFWMQWRGSWAGFAPGTRRDGFMMGLLFAVEFVLLFQALDLTTVSRASVIFYSMPVWMVIGGHLLIAAEPLTRRKSLGLLVAFGGVAWALADRDTGGPVSWAGDLMALGAAFCWAGIGLYARVSKISGLPPLMQLFWQVSVSSVLLLAASLFFGPFFRGVEPIHLWGLGFQIVAVVTFGFLFWFWLLKRYPAGGVASFGFLSPVFGVAFGWLLLGEEIGLTILGALTLVAAGIYLINTPGKRRSAVIDAKVVK